MDGNIGVATNSLKKSRPYYKPETALPYSARPPRDDNPEVACLLLIDREFILYISYL